jgi:hypothetical protein
MKPGHILDLAWGAAIVIATLLLADYAMAETQITSSRFERNDEILRYCSSS